MKNSLHQDCNARCCQEFEELKKYRNQEENTGNTTKIGGIFYAARSGITYNESIGKSSTKITRTIGIY